MKFLISVGKIPRKTVASEHNSNHLKSSFFVLMPVDYKLMLTGTEKDDRSTILTRTLLDSGFFFFAENSNEPDVKSFNH